MGTPRLPCTLRFVEAASRPGGSATASRSPAARGSAASAHGLLGGSGGSDAAGAAAAGLAGACLARRRWREFSVASAAPGWCCSLDWQSGEWRVADGSAGPGRRLGSGSLVLLSAVLVRGLRRGRSSATSAPATLVRRWVGLGCWEHADFEDTVGVLKVEAPVAHERAFIT